MEKFVLTLNSHSLSDFQKCEMNYALGNLLNIKPAVDKIVMKKGTEFARILQIEYYRKIKNKSRDIFTIDNLMRRWKKLFGEEEAFGMVLAFSGYRAKYKEEDWEPIAVEKGFSKLLYEDDKNIFIYEGRPDLYVRVNPNLTNPYAVVDHKTQGRHDNLLQYQNQPFGYCWALDTKNFIHNYIVFKKEPDFRRVSVSFSDGQIEQWKQDTIEWYFRIKHSFEKKKFLRSWNCEGKWGVCQYNEICKHSGSSAKGWVIKRDFIQKPRRFSW